MIRGEPAIGRDQSREPRLYSVEPRTGPDHEAVIRFCGQGSEAAGPFSQRHCSHSRMRIAATSDRHRRPGASSAVSCRTLIVLSHSQRVHAAGRSSTPSGTSPVVTRRHSAISSLRASATIIVVLRAPLGPSVRVRYQRASALSFWNIRKRHANWISPRRTRFQHIYNDNPEGLYYVYCHRAATQTIGRVMKSLVVKRSVAIAGHKTSVSLEEAFWKSLKEIGKRQGVSLSALLAAIDSERHYGNL